jgi:LacI family transcriptional regulator
MMAVRRKGGTTIIDVAKKLGVSAMTVSRAFNSSSEISHATRARVLECAEQMGYRPHRWARSLVTRRSSMVGVIVPDISHSFFAEVTRGIQEVVERAGYTLLLCGSWLDADKEKREIEMLVDSRVEGLMVASEQPERSPEVFLRLKEEGIPFVLLDRVFLNQEFPAARVDDLEVARLATEHLLDYGHRRIAFIQGPRLSSASLRYRGFMETMRKHHVPIEKELVARGHFDIDSGIHAMRRILECARRPTAVFAANDPMALGAVQACQEAGIAVPADISIVGAGNIEGEHHPYPFLTTVDWPRVQLGRAAATLLIAAIANPSPRDAHVEVFSPRLLIRQSTAPLKGASGERS